MSFVPNRRGFSVAHVDKRERMGPFGMGFPPGHIPPHPELQVLVTMVLIALALVLTKAHGDYVVGVMLGLC